MTTEDRVATWIYQLSSNDLNRRRLAACLLGIMGPVAKHAQTALTDGLYDEDSIVRQYAAIALGRIGWPPEGHARVQIGTL